MLESPAPLISHSLEGFPILAFSHTMGLPPEEHGSAPVVNDQLRSAASGLPARSLTPLLLPLTVAVWSVLAASALAGVRVAVLLAEFTVAATSVPPGSRNSKVALLTVAGSNASLKVMVTGLAGSTPVALDAGDVTVTVGGVVSGPTLAVNTTSTQ